MCYRQHSRASNPSLRHYTLQQHSRAIASLEQDSRAPYLASNKTSEDLPQSQRSPFLSSHHHSTPTVRGGAPVACRDSPLSRDQIRVLANYIGILMRFADEFMFMLSDGLLETVGILTTKTIEQYHRSSFTPQDEHVECETQSWYQEVSKLKAKYDSLQRTQRHLLGEDVGPLNIKELQNLEK
ncbi:hypothetical protein JHK85_025806 [Glycine max]|nr:hypothetical protein JHK85_025806 [Glycine max]